MSQIIPPTDFNASKNHKFTKNIFSDGFFYWSKLDDASVHPKNPREAVTATSITPK